MEFEKEIKKKLMQNDFAKNNGRILRTINILNGKFINVSSVQEVLKEQMNVGEFNDSLIYLHKSVYIEIKSRCSQKIVDCIDRYSFNELEVTLTQKGIKVLRGFEEDIAVEV